MQQKKEILQYNIGTQLRVHISSEDEEKIRILISKKWLERYFTIFHTMYGFEQVRGPLSVGPDFEGLINGKKVLIGVEQYIGDYIKRKDQESDKFVDITYLVVLNNDVDFDRENLEDLLPKHVIKIDYKHFFQYVGLVYKTQTVERYRGGRRRKFGDSESEVLTIRVPRGKKIQVKDFVKSCFTEEGEFKIPKFENIFSDLTNKPESILTLLRELFNVFVLNEIEHQFNDPEHVRILEKIGEMVTEGENI